MGQNCSRPSSPGHELSFERYPLLERQVEISFETHDFDSEGLLPYDVLEPVLRHHLMQCGLVEYMARFTREDGSLDTNFVRSQLSARRLSWVDTITVDQWKSIVCSWVEMMLFAQIDDARVWQEQLAAFQEEQAEKYTDAMEKFQRHYVKELESYYKEVEARHKEDERFRKEFVASEEFRNQFHEKQTDLLCRQERSAVTAYNAAMAAEDEAQSKLLNSLVKTHKPPRGFPAVKVASFIYPFSCVPCGAPVSGGSYIPRRRPGRRGALPRMPPSDFGGSSVTAPSATA